MKSNLVTIAIVTVLNMGKRHSGITRTDCIITIKKIPYKILKCVRISSQNVNKWIFFKNSY